MWERIIASICFSRPEWKLTFACTLQYFSGFWTTDGTNNKFDQSISSSSLWALVFILWKWWHRKRLVCVHNVLDRELGNGSGMYLGPRVYKKMLPLLGGRERHMAQNSPQKKLGFHNILSMVLPDPKSALASRFLQTTELQTCIWLNRTGLLLLWISKLPPILHRVWQKLTHKIFPPKRLDRTWYYRAMCHVLCCFLAIWNRFLTPVTHTHV